MQFFNQLYAGFNTPAFLGEVFTALTNTSMYTYEVAPVATLVEQELIRKMCRIVGYNDGEGVFLTGGSNANLVAMLSARNKLFPKIRHNGMYGLDKLTAYISDQSHYSLETAANLLGIGTDNVVKIKSDKKGRLIPSELEKAIKNSLLNGEKPFFILGTAATTLLGAFDPFDEMADIAQAHDIWFHIDGAFGGSLILGSTHKQLFNGLERADSFAWNPHKLMNIPLICSTLLLKQRGTLQGNLTDLDTDYIFHESESQNFDTGKFSIQCGRRVDSLKLWLAWKYYGDVGYQRRIDNLFKIAHYFARRVSDDDRLELLAEPQSITICFRDKLRISGKSIVNYGYMGDVLAIRFIAANAETEIKDIDRFFDNLFYAAGALLGNKI
jgi:glutamate/tyrosine decarboxylase-like PLP-dependent enzyme